MKVQKQAFHAMLTFVARCHRRRLRVFLLLGGRRERASIRLKFTKLPQRLNLTKITDQEFKIEEN